MAAIATLAVAAAGAALAWACTPKAHIEAFDGVPNKHYAPPGSQATVAGWEFEAGEPVQIRWTPGEQLIGSATVAEDGTFRTSVTIPSTASGEGVIVATARDSRGNTYRPPAPFYAGVPPAVAPEGETGGGSGNDSGAGSGSESGAGAPATSGTPGGAGAAPGSTPGATTSGGERAARRNGAGDERKSVAGGGQRSGSGGPNAAGAAEGAVTKLASGQAVFADSIGAERQRGAAAKRGSAETAPSERSASSDLWSGFGSDEHGTAASLGDVAGPASGPGSALTPSLALAGFGLVALMGGLAAAQLRRRRSFARSGTGPASSD